MSSSRSKLDVFASTEATFRVGVASLFRGGDPWMIVTITPKGHTHMTVRLSRDQALELRGDFDRAFDDLRKFPKEKECPSEK